MTERFNEGLNRMCEKCPLNNPNRSQRCTVLTFEWSRYYFDADFSPTPSNCRHYTCKDGKKSARDILFSGRISKLLLRRDVRLITGERFKAYPFGTSEKPFSEVKRYVTESGEIITTDMEGNHYLSPQQVIVDRNLWEVERLV